MPFVPLLAAVDTGRETRREADALDAADGGRTGLVAAAAGTARFTGAAGEAVDTAGRVVRIGAGGGADDFELRTEDASEDASGAFGGAPLIDARAACTGRVAVVVVVPAAGRDEAGIEERRGARVVVVPELATSGFLTGALVVPGTDDGVFLTRDVLGAAGVESASLGASAGAAGETGAQGG